MEFLHKSFTEAIVKLEKEYDVNSLMYKDLAVWPLLRLYIWTQLRHPQANYSRQGGQPGTKPLFDLSDQGRVRLAAKKCDLLFYARAGQEQYICGDICYDKFNDSIIEIASDTYKCAKFDFTGPASPIVANKCFKVARITGFASFREVAIKTINMKLDETFFVDKMGWVEQYRRLSKQILSIIQPKAIFGIPWYQEPAMGLAAACKQQNISFIDIEHGGLPKHCPVYTDWTCVPEDGYAMVPDFFWVWGEQFCKYTLRHPCHKPIIGGNTWLAKWIDNNPFPAEPGELDYYNNLRQQYEKLILVTLQPRSAQYMPLPPHLLETMQRGPQHWFWLIRIHPIEGDREPLEKRLKNHNITNYNITKATRYPLLRILKHCQHHITAYSSTCYEASALGVPTTIISPIGYETLNDFIDDGIMGYATNTDALLNSIRTFIPSKTPTIETRPEAAKRALQIIVGD